MAKIANSRAPTMATAVIAAESRDGAKLSIAGMAIMAVVLTFIQVTFDPIVRPAWLLDLWLIAMLSVCGFWGCAMVVFLRRRPDDAEVVGYWVRLGAIAQTALNLGIAVSPWVLLPNAEPGLRSLMIILYVWFLATEIMTSTPAVPVPAWEVGLLTASTAGFVLWSAPPYALIQAFFIVMIGATMIGLRTLVRRSTLAAVKARVASEQAEATTRIALAVTAAERDAKTRFIASASHDLRQPLQAAALFFESAVAGDEPAARARAIEGTRRAFASTSALIDQMLDHLRLEAGAIAVRPAPLELGPLIAAVAGEYSPAARAAGMQIIAVPGRYAAIADAMLLRRALGNLVANAVRHAQGERILIGSRCHIGSVTIWVIDDGNGVAPADRERLFEDYAQGSASAIGGFGLGLASARRALALIDGQAGLETRWTGGAAFYLQLPAAAAVVPRQAEALCRAA